MYFPFRSSFFSQIYPFICNIDEQTRCPTCGQNILKENTMQSEFRLNQFALFDHNNETSFVNGETPIMDEDMMDGDYVVHDSEEATIEYELESGQLVFINTISLPSSEGANLETVVPAMYIEDGDTNSATFRVLNLATQ